MKANGRKVVVRFRRDRGLWEVDYRDHAGRRCRPMFQTEADALDAAAKVRRELGIMPLVDDPEVTLDAYATRVLKAGLGEIEQKTRRGYQDIYDRHIGPVLGRLKVREIARLHVRGLLGTKRSAGLSKNTVRLIRATLSTILSEAMDDGYITGNPCYGVGRKGRQRAEAVTQAERVRKSRPMSPEQLVAFLGASAKHAPRYVGLFTTMAGTGVRPGEAFAFKPEDADFSDLTMRVERAVTDEGQEKDTKTHEVRFVDLMPGLAAALQQHLIWLKEEGQRRGWGEPVWLFPNEEGKPYNHRAVGKVFRRVLRKAGLPSFRLYDLRHSYASLLLERGAPITYVSEQLGHADSSTTLRVYAHRIPKGRRWVEILDGVLSEPKRLGPTSGTKVEPISKKIEMSHALTS